MILFILLLLAGSILLFYGADLVVKGGVHIAEEFQVSHLVIGLTVVAFGTSLPELVVSLNAALSGANTIAIGNIIGSNIMNIVAVLGISFMINDISITFTSINTQLFIMGLLTVLLFLALYFFISLKICLFEYDLYSP